MKKLLVLLVLTLLPVPVFATAQIPDRILYQGEEYPLFSEPLEQYLRAQEPRTEALFPSVCTACWRGYVATWEVKENFLYVTKLVAGTCRPDASEIPLATLFPGQTAPVKALWFSGTLRIPQGKQLRYERRGFGAVYERELSVRIEKGRVVNEMVIDNANREDPSRPGPLTPPLQ